MSEPRVPIVRAARTWVVIDKPSGLLSVPGRGPDKADCAISRVRAMFPGATGPLAPHRLDMDTSGLMILGLTPDAHRNLSRQFETRTVAKRYIAILERTPDAASDDWGTVELPIRLDPDNRPRQIHDPIQGKPSTTRWRLIERFDDGGARVEFEPVTGRSHQLRVHAAHPLGLNAPIRGDDIYGDPTTAPRLQLHATRLEFNDPETGERVVCELDAPF